MSKERLSSWDNHDSEKWHKVTRNGLHLAERVPFGLNVLEKFADHGERFENDKLQIVVGGVEFENPIMVGAGWDKAGEAIAALNRLGFSGVEVGTITPLPQPGNERPRQWMVAPGVSLNRLGFNSPGVDIAANNLERYRKTDKQTGVIGISIGKNKNTTPENTPADYFVATQKLYDYADYFAINVSSPNTPGLRGFQQKEPLTDIVHATISAMDQKVGKKPIFIKIAPDNLRAEDINDIIRIIIDNGLAGIIATNTTTNPNLKAKYGEKWRNELGGLAGDDSEFRRISNEMIKNIYKETNGKVDIIGVGGVNDTRTALEKMRSGAKVVQIVTGIRGNLPLHRAIFEQGKLPGRINREIVSWMEKEGISNLLEIVGQSAK